MKYKPHLKQICDSAERQGFTLTLTELKQTARYRLEREAAQYYYGW